MEKITNAKVANFNCTFKNLFEEYCLLDQFENIVFPALNDKSIYKTIRRNNIETRYHIADVKLIKMIDGNLALVGTHIKRTMLTISPDYDVNSGFIGEKAIAPSAPCSTFILLLNNHRVIYYTNDPGAPTIQQFAVTTKYIIGEYIKIQRKLLKKQWKDNKGVYEGITYKRLSEFTDNVAQKIYPTPELNIIPIESPDLVAESFEQISKISTVSFKFYKPNNETVDTNSFFTANYQMLERSGSDSIRQTLQNPTNKEIIESAVFASEGKTDYTVMAKTEDDEPITITPDKVSQQFRIDYDDDFLIEVNAKHVYNQVKEKKIVKQTSEENLSKFKLLYTKLTSLL